MATEYKCSINKSGSTYSTFAAWEDATDVDLTSASTKVFGHNGKIGTVVDGNSVVGQTSGATGIIASISNSQILIVSISGIFQTGEQMYVTVDVNYVILNTAGDSAIAVLECYTDNGAFTMPSSGVIFSGATTSTTNYRKVTVPEGHRHNGISSTGFRVIWSGSNPAIGFRVDENNFVFEWVVVLNQDGSSSSERQAIRVSYTAQSISVNINHCIVSCNNLGTGAGDGIRVSTSGSITNLVRNIAFGCKSRGFIATSTGQTVNMYNCTSFNNGADGFLGGSGLQKCYNCLSINNTTDYSSIDTITTSGSSDITGSVGLQNLIDSDEFIDPSGSPVNLHLKLGATSINSGTDLGIAPQGVNIDIDGRDVDALGDIWDLGADEKVSKKGSYAMIIGV